MMSKVSSKKNKEMQYVQASIGKRGFAYVLDWYLGSAFTAISVGLLWNIGTGETTINTDISLFEKPYGLLAAFLGFLFGILYFYVVPAFVWEGQTIGKKLMKIRIVGENGRTLTKDKLAVRQIIGISFLESAFMLTGNYITQIISIYINEYVGMAVNYLMLFLFIGTVVLTLKKSKSIHDFLAHSMVIEN